MILIQGRRMCPALENPEHGFIHGNHFWEGENVYFSCKPGYWLNGSSDRHCSLNGIWTEEKPKCIVLGKYDNSDAFKIFCLQFCVLSSKRDLR